MRTFSRVSIVLVLLVAAVGSPLLAAGHLFVGSFRNDRVIRFDAQSGALVDVFVPSGSGGLADPEGLAFGPDGNLYVVSFESNQILRYDGQTGAFLGVFVAAGSGGLLEPSGLLFTAGKLLVTSGGTNQVLSYNAATGAFAGVFVAAGSGGLLEPWPLAIGPDNNLYVGSNGNDRVLRYDGQTGAFLGTFVTAGSGGLNSVDGMTFGPDGRLYVSASEAILRYNGQTGAFVSTFVPAGSGGLSNPGGITFGPDGHLYVASTARNQVLRYNGQTGAFINAFVPPGTGGLDVPTVLLFRSAAAGPCVADAQTACLLGDRFEVKVKMKNFATPPATFPGIIQTYQGVSSETTQSVSFYSFTEGNVEIFVKMVNACTAPAFESFWLFAAGATNAATEITVRDSVGEVIYTINNPSGALFETVADTLAFRTCDD